MGVFFNDLSLELLLLAGVLTLFLYRRLRSRLDHFQRLGVPYVPARGLFDNNTFGAFGGESLGEVFDGVYRALAPHKYGGFFSTLSPSLLLRDPRTVVSLLTTHFDSFNDHGLPTDEKANPMEASLFSQSGPKWKALRRKLSPTFTSGKLKRMSGLIGDCADELSAFLARNTGVDLETRDLTARFTTDVIGSTAFGLEPESVKNPDSKFREMGRRIFHPGFFLACKDVLRFIFPSFFERFGISTEPKEVTQFFQSLTSQTLEHRRRTGEKRNDFVQLLLELKEKGSIEHDPTDLELEAEDEEQSEAAVKLEFTDDLLAAQAFVFFVAGFETTASALSFTLYLLARDEGARARARAEVKAAKAAAGGLTYDAVKSMPYLEACLDESLRIYPPFHVLPRVCTKDFVMEDGRFIPKGTPVFVPVYSLHRDPDYFPQPEEFRPERFLGEEKQKIVPGTYLPFGFGHRMCIARRFALLEASLCLANILDSFEFTLSPRMKEPLRLTNLNFVVVAVGGLWLRFEELPK